MRGLKLRTWHRSKNRMIGWDSIKFHKNINLFINLETIYVVMLFTGVKDKNGIDIYENDIIKVNTDVDISSMDRFLFEGQEMVEQEILCKVIYNEEIACFDLETIEPDLHLKTWGFYGKDIPNEMVVVGNIYQNKELLESS